MCSNYDPVINTSKLKAYFNVGDPPAGLRPRLWPGYVGPFIRKHENADVGDDAVPFRELHVGSFGMIPSWADDKLARRTYNARSETVHEKPSFKDSWRKSQHCIIPAEGFFEPDWRTGKAIPTRIVRADGNPIGIAGLWTEWKRPTGEYVRSFTMLTINADDHPFMRNFHKPEDEKRMIVILHEVDYDAWLSASPDESRSFLRQFPAELLTVSA